MGLPYYNFLPWHTHTQSSVSDLWCDFFKAKTKEDKEPLVISKGPGGSLHPPGALAPCPVVPGTGEEERALSPVRNVGPRKPRNLRVASPWLQTAGEMHVAVSVPGWQVRALVSRVRLCVPSGARPGDAGGRAGTPPLAWACRQGMTRRLERETAGLPCRSDSGTVTPAMALHPAAAVGSISSAFHALGNRHHAALSELLTHELRGLGPRPSSGVQAPRPIVPPAIPKHLTPLPCVPFAFSVTQHLFRGSPIFTSSSGVTGVISFCPGWSLMATIHPDLKTGFENVFQNNPLLRSRDALFEASKDVTPRTATASPGGPRYRHGGGPTRSPPMECRFLG